MARGLLENISPLWNPAKISDIQELDSVPKTFTARIRGMKDTHYWNRLKELCLICPLNAAEKDTSSCRCAKSLVTPHRFYLNIDFLSRLRLGNLAYGLKISLHCKPVNII
jgi:hypothetical protein